MRASSVSTGTVAPTSTRISVTRPLAGAGTSESILSVEISQMVSSACTQSPTRLRHSTTVPSATETPIWGMVTSTSVEPSVREELMARLLHAIDRRQDCLFQGGREGNGHAGGGHPHDRSVQVFEAPIGDQRGHLGARRARPVGLVEHDDLRAAAYRVEDRGL